MLLADDHNEIDLLLEDALTALTSGADGEAYRKIDYFWARLAMHIRAEHLHLFPALLEMHPVESEGSADIREKIERLHEDHDFFMRELVSAVKAMRLIDERNTAVTRDKVTAILEAIKTRLIEHNLIEERELYPLVPASAAGVGLTRSMKRELENLPPRFRVK